MIEGGTEDQENVFHSEIYGDKNDDSDDHDLHNHLNCIASAVRANNSAIVTAT